MKKTLSMILALLIIACSLPSLITSYADDSLNLLADATNANGKVTWTDKIDPRKNLVDSKTESALGGYSWSFGLGYADVQGTKYEYVKIKTPSLTVGTTYDFSYIYRYDFIFAIESIETANGDTADFTTPTTTNVTEKERSYKVATTFTVPVNGEYTITLKINRDMRTSDCKWNYVTLGDLSLTKVAAATNILENATNANGDVTWTSKMDPRKNLIDSKTESVNGGYSWSFGLGYADVVGSNYEYVYIKAKGLAADTRYDFSFIYQQDYAFAIDSIKASNGTAVTFESEPTDVSITGGVRARQVSTTFKAPVAGDYTITLKTNRDMRPTGSQWSLTVLSDLVLIKSTAAAKVKAEVQVSGNGDAQVSEDSVTVGGQVTYTAKPWNGEEFLGWYKGDQKLSDNLTYSFAITENTTLTAKFTSKSLNVLAGKKASDWKGWEHAKISDSTTSKNGGKGYLVDDAMYQSIYTTVTLKPNTEYNLSFNWKAVANASGVSFPDTVQVHDSAKADIDNRSNWANGGTYSPSASPDIESGGAYGNATQAQSNDWNAVITSFTTTSETEYDIVIRFGLSGGANHQQVNLSDFVLEEKNEGDQPGAVTDITKLKAKDWVGYQWSEISDTDVSHKGGNGYLVNKAMYQNMYTHVTLKPNTKYNLSFDWKSVANSVGVAYPNEVVVVSDNDIDIENRSNWNDSDFKYGSYDLETGGHINSAEIANTLEWQSNTVSFTTKGDTEYSILIHFQAPGNGGQQVYMSDFLLEEVQEGGGQTPPPSAELTDITKLNATDWRGVRWSKISDSTDSKDGGKAYKVDDAMNQNINTTLTLKPKNNYKLTFNWKALANDKGLAYLMRTTVYSAKSGNHALPATSESDSKWGSECNYKFESWNDYTPIYVPNSPYSNLVTSSSMPNASADAADSALTSWNTCTVEFTTTDDLEYYLFLNFGLKGSNGKQAVIVSDFVLEDLGGASEDDANNLAASYSNANGHVTWTDNAGTHFVDNTSSIEGGYSWGFGMPNSSFNGEGGLEPVYIYITTDALEAGKNYEFSFIYEKDFIIDYYSIDQGAEVYKGPDDVKLLEGDRAHRVTVRFTAKKDGVHKITLKTGKGHNNQNCGWDKVILCDLKLYDITNRVDCSVEAELGGTVSGWDDIYCTKGKKVTLVATPLTGNTFEGWYDENGDLVSSEATYSFTVEKDFHLTAKFKGKNIPNVEWLTEHDMDGTFENGTMMGWVAEDRDNGDDSGWAYYNRSDEKPYNGSYSMKVRARHRTSVFHFDNLKKGTNYVLSFYVNFPADYIDMVDGEPVQSGDLAHIRYFGLEAGGASLYSETGPVIKAGAGWYKINLYFNTGDFNFVDWIYMYTQKTGSVQEFLYFDDISLTQYVSGEFENGTFETNTAPWRGDVVAENGVAKVAEGKKFYQNVNTGKNTLHKVTFKAKGKGIAGATQVTNDEPSILNALSSTSFVNIDSSDWKTYSFDVYSNVNPDISLFFKSTEGDLLVDDIAVTKDGSVGDAVVENIDFETERFALHEQSDVYEIYNGTKGDANVHSGSKSLLFKAANAAKGEEYILQDAFTSYQISAKVNYKITFYYKTAKGNTLYLSPKYLPTDEDAIKTTYTAAGNGWTKVEFFYSNITATYVKAIFSNIANKTNADFYVDDISITIAPPMVIETNSANKYCEWPLNILNNEGFEKELTDKDWPNLPKTIKLRTDKGANGENYLRVNAKTHYVLAVQVDKGESYYFSVSTRLGKGASGYVAVTTDAAGTKLYNDSEGVPSSKITGNSNGWGRQAILFTPRDDGLVYIVLAADSGYIDVDDIYLYKKQYGKDYDPNDHTTFVPYNFDNPDPATVVLNGGDPTFGGNEITEEDVDSPSTGDNRVAPAIILFVSTFAALGLLATKKKTKKNTEGGNA